MLRERIVKGRTLKPAPCAALAVMLAGPGFAQAAGPGENFVANWDQDGGGPVTLAEATVKREPIFAAFDADDDGFLSDEEFALLDEMRANNQAAAGPGIGQGSGKAQGKGIGLGMGSGFAGQGSGLQCDFNDTDGDGRVNLGEFLGRTADWFAAMDRDGDGVVGVADFGRG